MTGSVSRAMVALLAVPAVVLGALLFVVLALLDVSWWLALVVALIVAVTSSLLVHLGSDGFVMRTIGAAPIDPADEPRLHNLVEGLCLANGFHEPDLFVVDRPEPNALAAGRTARHGHVVVTTGLVSALDRVELEGVLAHLLSRIRSGDTAVGVHVALVGGVLLRPLPGIGSRIARRFLPGPRNLDADLAGVSLTRYPPGLEGALTKMAASSDADWGRTTSHLWIVPGRQAMIESPFGVDDRITVLGEL